MISLYIGQSSNVQVILRMDTRDSSLGCRPIRQFMCSYAVQASFLSSLGFASNEEKGISVVQDKVGRGCGQCSGKIFLPNNLCYYPK
jgi:hypothetical protein